MASLGYSEVVFESCAFHDNTAEEGGGLFIEYPGPTRLQGCTLARNHAATGANFFLTAGPEDTLLVDRSIIAFGAQSEGVFWNGEGVLELTCVDIFGNDGGDWVGAIADQETAFGNLHADPQFCWGWNQPLPLSLAAGSPCALKNNPDCGLIGAFPVGCGLPADASNLPHLTIGFQLHPCYPNPFNPATTISFELDFDAEVFLAIHDSGGKLVRRLEGGFFAAGPNTTVWHGTNDQGQTVASGVYFVRLTIGRQSEVQKMVLLR